VLLEAAPAVPVGVAVGGVAAAASVPLGETSVRMNPPARFELVLVDGAAVADPAVPVAFASADRRHPLTVIVCAESDFAAPACSAGAWADAATASAAENTVPNIK
jgi:hypothetical protein